MRRIVSTLLIITGLVILLYPLGKGYYVNYQQDKLMKEWQEISANLTEEAEGLEPVENDEARIARKQEEARLKARQEYIQNNVEGILTIDKINLKLPILKGVSPKNLEISAASMENMGKPGQKGNYAISGHRNYGYGRHFNRLDELNVGDIISLEANNAEYIYKVEEKLYVQPEEVWVLEANGRDREITLITCHPERNPTQRLIIKGKLSY